MRKHVSILTRGLDPARFVSTLFAPATVVLDPGCEFIPHRPLVISARASLASDLKAILNLSSMLCSETDIVHAHGLRGAWIGVLAARKAGIPALFTAHNLVPHLNPLALFCMRMVGKSSDRIVAVSHAVAASLVKAGVQPDRVVVIPNGIDVDAFMIDAGDTCLRTELAIASNARVIVAVGRLAPEKGFDVLIRAYSVLRRLTPSIELLIVGSGPSESQLKRLAADLAPNTRFVGAVTKVAPYLHLADVVAIPSFAEGQGIVALEAMACRKPIVASRVGGLVETIRDLQSGLLVLPGSPEALADALTTVLADERMRVAFGKKGFEVVESEYSAAKMIRAIEEEYLRLAW